MYLAIGIWKDACRQLLKSRCVICCLRWNKAHFAPAQLDSSSFDNLRWYSTDFEFNQRYPTAYLQKQKRVLPYSTWAKLLLEDKT